VVPKQNPRALADALRASLAANRRTTAQSAVTLEGLFRSPAVMAAYDAVYSAARSASTVR
jgi:hypothetical protein